MLSLPTTFHLPFLLFFLFSSSSLTLSILSSTLPFRGTSARTETTRNSHFRTLNRRALLECIDLNPYLSIKTSANSSLADEEYVNVTVSGVLRPSKRDWVAMITPSHMQISGCPQNALLYAQTGDLSKLPLLCHYPVKAAYLSSDPSYLGCEKKECKEYGEEGGCVVSTCSGSVTFHVVNVRTEIEFVFLTGGFETPCILKKSEALPFANPRKPLYAHLSSVDSSGKSMRLTWVSGDGRPQQVQYGNGKFASSKVTTFTQNDMCTSVLPSPAKDFGWHDPGYIHSAVMTELNSASLHSYKYGSDLVGWSDEIQFRTPPAGGSDELRFLVFGDMGKAPRDSSLEHYIQPGSLSVVEAMTEEVASVKVDSIFHIGDISYATGFLVEWDYFLQLISPVASRVSYMTAIGNHERDYINSGSVYGTPDSGGECGVAYETYFPMPTSGKDKPWYSIEQASVHFTVISTEHEWKEGSEQYEWIKNDMQSVDRAQTPWLFLLGHRPMYTSIGVSFLPSVDPHFVRVIEPLLMIHKVDVAFFGHVHNYERTCALYLKECKSMPIKDKDGIDTYNNRNYSAPVHVIVGMAGFSLDKFTGQGPNWSLSRISEFGYARVHATREAIKVEFLNSTTKEVQDSFRIIK